MNGREFYPKIPQDDRAKYAKIRLTTKQRHFKRLLVAAFFLFYILIGAFIFSALEHPLETELCNQAVEEIDNQIANFEKTKEYLKRKLLFENKTIVSDSNLTTVFYNFSSEFITETTTTTENLTNLNTTNILTTPAPVRARRQANINDVIFEYEFCTDNKTGSVIMEQPDADLLIILRSSNENFFSSNILVAGINKDKIDLDSSEDYKKLFNGLKSFSITTGLRFVNDFAQLTLKWTGSTAICFQRINLKLPNGMQVNLIAKEKKEAKYIWFSSKCDDFIDRQEYEISTNCRETANYFFNHEWTSWQDWSACSTSCGIGSRQRTRACGQRKQNYNEFSAIPSERFSVLPVEEIRKCVNLEEDYFESEACLNSTCPFITEWSNWSDCSATCGFGVVSRNRKCEFENDENCLDGKFEAKICENEEKCENNSNLEESIFDGEKIESTTISDLPATERVCEEQEVKEIVKEVEKLIEIETEECAALKRQGLPPCVYEVMQNLTFINGKSNLLFDQSAQFSFTLDNIGIPYALDGNVTDMLSEISRNLTVLTQNLTLFSYNMTDPLFENVTIGETQIWEFALTRKNLDTEALSKSILSSVSGIIRNEVDFLVERANLTANQSIELIDVNQGDRLYTVAKLRKTREDVGNITCEIDSIFERFIIDFLVDEPKRFQHVMSDVNTVLDDLEEAKSQSIIFMRELSSEFNENLTSAVESEMRMAEELKTVEQVLLNKELTVQDQEEKIGTCGDELETTLEKYLDCRVPKRKINGSIYGTDSYLQPEVKIHESLLNFVPSYSGENTTFTCPNFWNYKNSLFYVFNSVAVIGSKDMEPFTPSGKIFKIFYSVIGICAFLALYISIASYFFAKINHKMARLGKNYASDKKYVIQIGIVIVLFLSWLCFLVLIPSNAISKIEGWSFAESIYFMLSSSFFSAGADSVPSFLNDAYLLSVYRIVIIIWNFLSILTVFVIIRFIISISKDAAKARKRQFEESVRQKPIIERNVHSKEIVKQVPIPKPRRPRKEVREEEQAAKRSQFGNNKVRYMQNIQL